jgi:hypothetical protein
MISNELGKRTKSSLWSDYLEYIIYKLYTVKKILAWCPRAEFSLNIKDVHVTPYNLWHINKSKGNSKSNSKYFINNEEENSVMKIENDDVDIVSTGLIVIIIGLSIILFAHYISDFFFISDRVTVIQNKYFLIPSTINPVGIMVFGVLVSTIGFAIFLKNFINLSVDTLIQRLNH